MVTASASVRLPARRKWRRRGVRSAVPCAFQPWLRGKEAGSAEGDPRNPTSQGACWTEGGKHTGPPTPTRTVNAQGVQASRPPPPPVRPCKQSTVEKLGRVYCRLSLKAAGRAVVAAAAAFCAPRGLRTAAGVRTSPGGAWPTPARRPPRPRSAHAPWLSGHAAAVVRPVGGAAKLTRPRSRPPEAPRGLSLAYPGAHRSPAYRGSRCFSESLSLKIRRVIGMARGNQRELARQKNMKKTQEISKGKRKEDSLTTSQRKQRDSEIMQQKQKAANEKKSMQTREK
ncbi:uncharacterized protein RHO17_007685 [Thomomys bottae]